MNLTWFNINYKADLCIGKHKQETDKTKAYNIRYSLPSRLHEYNAYYGVGQFHYDMITDAE